MLRAALILIARLFLCVEKDGGSALGARVFDAVMPVLIAHTKVPEIVSNGFAVLTLCVPLAREKVTERKAVTAASVMMSVHNDDRGVVSNIMAFLYACAGNGELQEIKGNRAVLPTAMKALKAHADGETIVERGVGLAILCDHPNKEVLLRSALVQFPASSFLRQFVSVISPGA